MRLLVRDDLLPFMMLRQRSLTIEFLTSLVTSCGNLKLFIFTLLHDSMFLQLPARESATKLLEKKKREDALALQKRNQSYGLIDSDSDEEFSKTSKKLKKSRKRQLRNKKESSGSEE